MQAVLHSFAYSLDFVRAQVAVVTPPQFTAQPAGAPNHAAWVIGHLCAASQEFAGALGAPPWLPEGWWEQFGSGSTPTPEVADYPTKERLLDALRDAEMRVTRAVEGFDQARLDEPFPVEEYRPVFPTMRHAMTQVLVGHTAYHVGQLGVWRRAMNLPSVGRSYE